MLVGLGVSGDVNGGMLAVTRGLGYFARLRARPGMRARVYGITMTPGTSHDHNTLPSLPSRQEVDPDTWDLVRHVNALGSSGLDAHVATLWRHLSRWPAFLSVTYTAFAPMQADGSVARAANQMVKLAHDEGRRFSAWRDPATDLTEPARKTITAYVTSPHQVARMVAIGHAMAAWLPKP